jgi:hypothetical protein
LACRGEAEGEDGRSSRLRGSIFSFLTARVAQAAKAAKNTCEFEYPAKQIARRARELCSNRITSQRLTGWYIRFVKKTLRALRAFAVQSFFLSVQIRVP